MLKNWHNEKPKIEEQKKIQPPKQTQLTSHRTIQIARIADHWNRYHFV